MERTDALTVARWQFRVVWSLAEQVHLPRLTTAMCLWTAAPSSWTVRQDNVGQWRADWSDVDPVDPASPSIGWLTWHVTWWWRNALDAVKGGVPEPGRRPWAGSAELVVAEIRELALEWTDLLESLDDTATEASVSYPWPNARSAIYTVSWVNLELMKNVAEIGQVANMYANRRDG